MADTVAFFCVSPPLSLCACMELLQVHSLVTRPGRTCSSPHDSWDTNTALNQYFVSSLAEEPKEQPQVFSRKTVFNNTPKDGGGAGEGAGGVWWSEPLAGLGFGKNRLAAQSVWTGTSI